MKTWTYLKCSPCDVFWKAGSGLSCWNCGQPGSGAYAPLLNSQMGHDPVLIGES